MLRPQPTRWFEIIAAHRGMVRSLHIDGDGTIWAGTYDSGLHRIRQGRVSTTLHATLRTGSVAAIGRPAGRFVYPAGDDRPLVLIAGYSASNRST